ncbi:MAG: hypothetical protein RI947_376 [Candidatus Parcubacteria bacterium]
MNRSKIVDNLTNKRVKDYSFTIAFFLIFSFFILFAIRPNLVTVFSLQKELNDLRVLDNNYENAILNIVQLQSMVEANRNNLFLLDQSLPQIPQVNKVIDDLNKAASDSGVLIKKVDIGEVNLKVDKSSRDTKTFAVDIETESDFTQVRRFIDVFMSQRRLKTMTNLSIIKEVGGFGDSFGSSESAILKIKLEVDGHYL